MKKKHFKFQTYTITNKLIIIYSNEKENIWMMFSSNKYIRITERIKQLKAIYL